MKNISKLSIVIPVFNEVNTIRLLLERVDNADIGGIKKEIIVVNDGSKDKTLKELKKAKRDGVEFKLINHPKNLGKSAALRTGFRYITGEVTVIQDGDMEYDPNDFKKMIKRMKSPKVRVVYGSRRLEKKNIQYSGFSFFIGGLILTYMVNILYRGNITDEPTCYKMFDTTLLQKLKLQSQRFEFCPEVTAKILRLGEKIYEVPISYNPRHANQGKKIKARDFFEAVWVLVKYRFYFKSLISEGTK